MDRTDGFYTKNFLDFWVKRVQEVEEAPLIITGIGFDPRSLRSAKIFKKNEISPKILPIDFSVQSTGVELNDAKETNIRLLHTFDLVSEPLEIDMFDSQGKPVGGRLILNKIYEHREFFNNVCDVILDIGGLPRSLFAPLLSNLVSMQKAFMFKNLHVASLPNEKLDNGIVSEQILEPNYMYGFKRPVTEDKIVWIPIIGKNDPGRLRSIHNKIENDCVEICPVLPFRPNNPKQIDNLIVDLRNILFHEFRTFNNNIIYVDHRSPFIVYKEITELSKYYKKLLNDLSGEVNVLVTPLDDKTSCVGAILAAIDEDLPVMYADTVSYNVPSREILSDEIEGEPLEIWVSGEAYYD